MARSGKMHFFLILLALASFAFTFPVDSPNSTHPLVKRGCKFDFQKPGWVCDDEIPKLGENIQHLQDDKDLGKAQPGSRAVFYNNLDDPNIGVGKENQASWVAGWMNAKGLKDKHYWWADAVNQYWITAQAKYIRDNQEKNKEKWGANAISNFNQRFYQALALAAQHEEAYLMIRGDREPKPGSVWDRVEYPSLTTNPKIQRIYRIDPRAPKERGKPDDCEPDKPTLIWDRAKDRVFKPSELPFKCPWLG